jgi:glycerol-3-phosphate dehydrogenase
MSIGDLEERKNNLNTILKADPTLNNLLHPSYPFTKAEVIYAVKHEMAMCVEDVLARRIRLLFLDARLATELAPLVASLMAPFLNKDKNWELEEVKTFTALAEQYILK